MDNERVVFLRLNSVPVYKVDNLPDFKSRKLLNREPVSAVSNLVISYRTCWNNTGMED